MKVLPTALLMATLLLFGAAPPASAAPTTDVIQGDIIRLVSVADWDAAGSLLPGQPMQWDVEVSAEAPEPGAVTIAMSAIGDAELMIDAWLCMQPWTGDGCPGDESRLTAGWVIPRDGGQTAIALMRDTETAHVRIFVSLGEGSDGARTDIRLHASGIGDPVTIGSDGELAATGSSSSVWGVLVGVAIIILSIGAVLARVRGSDSRRTRGES